MQDEHRRDKTPLLKHRTLLRRRDEHSGDDSDEDRKVVFRSVHEEFLCKNMPNDEMRMLTEQSPKRNVIRPHSARACYKRLPRLSHVQRSILTGTTSPRPMSKQGCVQLSSLADSGPSAELSVTGSHQPRVQPPHPHKRHLTLRLASFNQMDRLPARPHGSGATSLERRPPPRSNIVVPSGSELREESSSTCSTLPPLEMSDDSMSDTTGSEFSGHDILEDLSGF